MSEGEDRFEIDSFTSSTYSSLQREHRDTVDIDAINTSAINNSVLKNISLNNSALNTSRQSTTATSTRRSRTSSNRSTSKRTTSVRTTSKRSSSKRNPHYSEHNRSGFSSELSSTQSSRQTNQNQIYQFDDISSLHYDEYGYDKKPKDGDSTTTTDDDDDDSISEFFKAPTKQELSSELFQLVEPTTSASDALQCLGNLRKWGIVADTDPTTMKHLVEFQAVPTLLYFVRGAIARRKALKLEFVENIKASKNRHNNNTHSTEKGIEFRNHREVYLKKSNINELGLQQAMQVVHHYTCFSDSESDNKKKSLKSLVLKKAILAQLVEIDGIDLLVNVLEEQLADLIKRKNKENISVTTTPTDQHGHAISKSIWLILMNVGACDHAVQLLKEQRNPPKTSKAGRLVAGIVMGLNYRFQVSGSEDQTLLHIMPQWALSSGLDCYNQANDLLECQVDNNNSSSSSWMEDLFVALCRLVGSKDAEDLDRSPSRHATIQPNEHDEIRILLVDLFVVKKCLQALIDEPNTVLGQDPFVTTLALSFFYACIRFSDYRYKVLKEKEAQKQQKLQCHRGAKAFNLQATEAMLAVSLDYERLAQFTLQSIRSFPTHHLIQGTGCLLLEAIPRYEPGFSTTFASDCIGVAAKNCTGDGFHPGLAQSLMATTCGSEIADPCRWYFSDA